MIDVTCVCNTHGRPWLLAEAVESFGRQKLGDIKAELLVLNDCRDQVLFCDVPGVRIEQGMDQYPEMSIKWNAAVDMARGKWIMAWDDDDISLPYRIQEAVNGIGDADAYRPGMCWNWGCMEIRGIGKGGVILTAAMWRKDVYLEVGGSTVGKWNDKSFWDKVWPRNNSVQPEVTYQYVYRWAGVGYHDSGKGAADGGPLQRAKDFHAFAVNDPRYARGDFFILPRWWQNYEQMCKQAMFEGKHRKYV